MDEIVDTYIVSLDDRFEKLPTHLKNKINQLPHAEKQEWMFVNQDLIEHHYQKWHEKNLTEDEIEGRASQPRIGI